MASTENPVQKVTITPRVVRIDGWHNVMTGLGTYKDKLQWGGVCWQRRTEQELSELYAADASAAKVVDEPITQAFRKPFKPAGLEADPALKLRNALRAICTATRFKEAWRLGRLHGGGALLMVTDQVEDLSLPLVEGEEIKNLVVLSRYDLYSDMNQLVTDIRTTEFGKPAAYTLRTRGLQAVGSSNTKGQIIDASRIISFPGVWLPPAVARQDDGWGDSVLNRLWNPLRNYNLSHDAAANALQDLSVAVFKMKGLADMLLANQDLAVQKRMEIINLCKSVARAVMIDSEGEDFDHKTRSVAGMRELLEKVEARLVAATPFPHTVFFGESPVGGLGQSGNHEQDNFYDYIAAEQEDYVKPRLLRLMKVVAASLGLAGEDMDIEFDPLYQQDEKDVVTTRKAQAEIDEKYWTMGALLTEEIRQSRFGGDKYSIETDLDEDLSDPALPAGTDPDLARGAAPPALLPAPAPGSTATPPAGEDVQKTALNGAQVTSLVEVVTAVANGTISRQSGIRVVMLAFQVSEAEAAALMGPEDFKPEKAPAPAPPSGDPANPGGRPPVPPPSTTP